MPEVITPGELEHYLRTKYRGDLLSHRAAMRALSPHGKPVTSAAFRALFHRTRPPGRGELLHPGDRGTGDLYRQGQRGANDADAARPALSRRPVRRQRSPPLGWASRTAHSPRQPRRDRALAGLVYRDSVARPAGPRACVGPIGGHLQTGVCQRAHPAHPSSSTTRLNE